MLDRSQYSKYQTMNSYGIPSSQELLGGTGYAPNSKFNFLTRQPDLPTGEELTEYGVSNMDFMKRPDALSAGTAGPMDYFQGGDYMGALGSMFKDTGFLGSTDAKGIKSDGWGGTALGALSSLGNAYMGMKQYGLAKDSLNFQKKAYEQDRGVQMGLLTNQLKDRSTRRNNDAIANGKTPTQSTDDYMAGLQKYGIA